MAQAGIEEIRGDMKRLSIIALSLKVVVVILLLEIVSMDQRLKQLEAQQQQVQTQVQQIIVDLPERWFWRKGETRP